MELKDKNVLVTGASSGIGQAIVIAVSENDAIHGEIITVDGGVGLVKGL